MPEKRHQRLLSDVNRTGQQRGSANCATARDAIRYIQRSRRQSFVERPLTSFVFVFFMV